MAPEISWVKGNAEDLPFDDQSFNKISCQFGLMFFQDQVKALNEMIRVLADQGQIIIAIWDLIEANEGYNELLHMLEGMSEQNMVAVLKALFCLGKRDEIVEILNDSNVSTYHIETVKNEVEFRSLAHWIDCDVKASPIADKITDLQYANLLAEAEVKLHEYVTSKGSVKFNMSAPLVTIE